MRALVKAVLVAAVVAPCVSAQAALVHHYTGDNTPNDSVGGANATLLNGATYGSGKFGQGFSFAQASYNGGINTQDAAEVTAGFGLNTATGMTISAWVNPTDATTGDFQMFAGRG